MSKILYYIYVSKYVCISEYVIKENSDKSVSVLMHWPWHWFEYAQNKTDAILLRQLNLTRKKKERKYKLIVW